MICDDNDDNDDHWSATCISNPSLVRASGQAITPALLIRMSIWENLSGKTYKRAQIFWKSISKSGPQFDVKVRYSNRTLEKVLEIFLQHSFTLLRLLRSSLLKFPVPSSDYLMSGWGTWQDDCQRRPEHRDLPLGCLPDLLGSFFTPFQAPAEEQDMGASPAAVITNHIFLEHQNINSHHNHFHFLPAKIQRSIFSNASVRAPNCNQTAI